MIDLILLCFFLGSVYGGFKLGNNYASLSLLYKDVVAKIKAAL